MNILGLHASLLKLGKSIHLALIHPIAGSNVAGCKVHHNGNRFLIAPEGSLRKLRGFRTSSLEWRRHNMIRCIFLNHFCKSVRLSRFAGVMKALQMIIDDHMAITVIQEKIVQIFRQPQKRALCHAAFYRILENIHHIAFQNNNGFHPHKDFQLFMPARGEISHFLSILSAWLHFSAQSDNPDDEYR